MVNLPKQGRAELHIIHAHWPLWSVAVSEKVKPGEITLAYNGVLFLDKLPEFPQHVIDA